MLTTTTVLLVLKLDIKEGDKMSSKYKENQYYGDDICNSLCDDLSALVVNDFSTLQDEIAQYTHVMIHPMIRELRYGADGKRLKNAIIESFSRMADSKWIDISPQLRAIKEASLGRDMREPIQQCFDILRSVAKNPNKPDTRYAWEEIDYIDTYNKDLDQGVSIFTDIVLDTINQQFKMVFEIPEDWVESSRNRSFRILYLGEYQEHFPFSWFDTDVLDKRPNTCIELIYHEVDGLLYCFYSGKFSRAMRFDTKPLPLGEKLTLTIDYNGLTIESENRYSNQIDLYKDHKYINPGNIIIGGAPYSDYRKSDEINTGIRVYYAHLCDETPADGIGWPPKPGHIFSRSGLVMANLYPYKRMLSLPNSEEEVVYGLLDKNRLGEQEVGKNWYGSNQFYMRWAGHPEGPWAAGQEKEKWTRVNAIAGQTTLGSLDSCEAIQIPMADLGITEGSKIEIHMKLVTPNFINSMNYLWASCPLSFIKDDPSDVGKIYLKYHQRTTNCFSLDICTEADTGGDKKFISYPFYTSKFVNNTDVTLTFDSDGLTYKPDDEDLPTVKINDPSIFEAILKNDTICFLCGIYRRSDMGNRIWRSDPAPNCKIYGVKITNTNSTVELVPVLDTEYYEQGYYFTQPTTELGLMNTRTKQTYQPTNSLRAIKDPDPESDYKRLLAIESNAAKVNNYFSIKDVTQGASSVCITYGMPFEQNKTNRVLEFIRSDITSYKFSFYHNNKTNYIDFQTSASGYNNLTLHNNNYKTGNTFMWSMIGANPSTTNGVNYKTMYNVAHTLPDSGDETYKFVDSSYVSSGYTFAEIGTAKDTMTTNPYLSDGFYNTFVPFSDLNLSMKIYNVDICFANYNYMPNPRPNDYIDESSIVLYPVVRKSDNKIGFLMQGDPYRKEQFFQIEPPSNITLTCYYTDDNKFVYDPYTLPAGYTETDELNRGG